MTKKTLTGLESIDSQIVNTDKINIANNGLFLNRPGITYTSDVAINYTTNDLKTGFIYRNFARTSGNATELFPSGTSIVNDLNLKTGDSFNVFMNIANTGVNILYTTVGSGGTFKTNNSATGVTKNFSIYNFVITSPTTYDLYRSTPTTLL